MLLCCVPLQLVSLWAMQQLLPILLTCTLERTLPSKQVSVHARCLCLGGGVELGFVVGWLSTFINKLVDECDQTLGQSACDLCFIEFLRSAHQPLGCTGTFLR